MLKKRIRYKLYCDECGLKAVTKTGDVGGRLPSGKKVNSDKEAIAAVNYHQVKGKIICDKCYKRHQKKLMQHAKNQRNRKNKPDSKYCQLTLHDRWIIRDGLNARKSFRAIAKELDVSPSTIMREVQRHATPISQNDKESGYSDCLFRKDCPRHVCLNSAGNKCSNYEKEVCRFHENAPYVCNGCPYVDRCVLEKRYYQPGVANNNAEAIRSSARSKKKLSDIDVKELSQKISPYLREGKSLYLISKELNDLGVSRSTLYRYRKAGKI